METNKPAQTEARAIVADAIERCKKLHDYAGRPAWEQAVGDAISTALAAKDAELARLKAQLVAAWNAFGPSSSRGDEPPFDTDDLEHLPRSACGGLDEQIRELEDRAERAEAQLVEIQEELAVLRANQSAHVEARAALTKQLAEANKALEPFARADRAIGDERGPFRFETGTGYVLIEREHFRAASRAREARGGE